MNTSTHSLVIGFSVVTAAMFGLLARSLLGGFLTIIWAVNGHGWAMVVLVSELQAGTG